MTTLQSSDINQPTTADSTIEFRVSRPGLPRRRLKLVGTRYTIGSGAECSVRLDDSSVRPTHAVLVKDDAKVRLRAFGAPIVVNGRPATESELHVGDRFLIGEYEFELSLGPVADRSTVSVTPMESSQTKSQLSTGVLTGKLRAQDRALDSKVVPRRRVSFASQMKFVDVEAAEISATQEVGGTATNDDVEKPELASSVPTIEPVDTAEPEETAQPEGTIEAEAASSLPSFDSVVEPIVTQAEVTRPDDLKGRHATAELFDQYRAILANERRWQERSKRQLERFRQREQKSAAQIELLKASQEAAERRARGAEDAVQSLKQQVTELAGRLSAVTSTVMPGLEQRLNQQYEESVVASRQYQSLMEGLRGRLDFLQSALTEVQAETEEIRQQTVATREDQQEVVASTDTLEQALQKMAEDYQAERVEADAKVEQLRQSLYQTSLKLSDLTGQLEETRQNGHGLGALVQQLRSSLQNAQTEAQRYATFEQIDEAMRLLKANDQRISQLTEEYDSQSSQLHQECEALRQRLEDSEHLANKAIAAASDALNQALEQRHALEALLEGAQHPSASQPTASTQQVESTAVVQSEVVFSPVDSGVVVKLNSQKCDDESFSDYVVDSLEPGVPEADITEEQDQEIADLYERESLADEVNEVSWIDSDEPEVASVPEKDAGVANEIGEDDAEGYAIEDEELDYSGQPKSLSQSAFHLPLEIDVPTDTQTSRTQSLANQGIDSAAGYASRPLRSGPECEAEYVEQQHDSGEILIDATYQYDPELSDNFSAFRSHNVQQLDGVSDAVDEPLSSREVREEETNDLETEGEYTYQATAFFDSDVSSIHVGQHLVESQQDVEEDAPDLSARNSADEVSSEQSLSTGTSTSTTKSGPRSAAEVLASLGINIDESEEEPVDDRGSAVDEDQPLISQSSTYQPVRAGAMDTQHGGLRSSDALPNSNAAPDATKEDQVEEEESIEAYMNRLLRRVQGQSESEPAPAPVEPKAQIVEPIRESAKVKPQEQPEKQTASLSSSVSMESPYVPRSQAPEKTSNLAAMRELANSSARTAIAASARRKMSNEVLFKYGLFGMGLLAGGAVLMGTRFEFGPWMVIALCCFGLAVFFLMEGISLRRQLMETASDGGTVNEEIASE